jgi:hypothetical protein
MNNQITYILSDIPNFNTFISTGEIPSDESHFSAKKYTTKSTQEYSFVRYVKEFLHEDMINSYGLLRSVIVSNSNIVCFSPPKALAAHNFMTKYPEKKDNIIAEQFIEGTMINVFFDSNCGEGIWRIATRNTIDADVSFYKGSNITFHKMFNEACMLNNVNINALNKQYCYSFVLQHPSNRIVVPFKSPQLYLVAVYEISQNNNDIRIIEKNLDEIKPSFLGSTNIKFPQRYSFGEYNQLIEQFASSNTTYDVVGIMVKNLQTGERTKFRNPVYEEVRHLRGNQPKLQYQYLHLRHSGKMPEFLKYYPEMKNEMSKYRDQVHAFTENLHKNYVACYIKKEQKLGLYPEQYRTHMFKLHEHFISNLRPKGLCVTNTEVIKYVNQLHPSLLMYCLNYHMRKRAVDTIKADTSKN